MTKSFLLLLCVLLAASHFAVSKPTIVGGWSPIKNVTDEHVQGLGAFAVWEHDRETNDTLLFVKVVKGEQQVVEGMNYRLVLKAKHCHGATAKYVAVVWERVWLDSRELTSFKLYSG